MAEAETVEAGTRAPYMPFTTLKNFITKLGEGPIPPRIDKGYLDNYSGATQGLLLGTLKLMGFIDDAGSVQPKLREAAGGEPQRKRLFREFVDDFYIEQLALAEQAATSQQLWESFAPYKGSTLRKAVVFYLAIVEFTGAPNSPHFKPPRQVQGKPAKKPRHTDEPGAAPTATPDQDGADAQHEGEVVEVNLGAAGSVRLVVNVRWLELPDDTFVALRQLTKDLRALEYEVEDLPDEEDDDA